MQTVAYSPEENTIGTELATFIQFPGLHFWSMTKGRALIYYLNNVWVNSSSWLKLYLYSQLKRVLERIHSKLVLDSDRGQNLRIDGLSERINSNVLSTNFFYIKLSLSKFNLSNVFTRHKHSKPFHFSNQTRNSFQEIAPNWSSWYFETDLPETESKTILIRIQTPF